MRAPREGGPTVDRSVSGPSRQPTDADRQQVLELSATATELEESEQDSAAAAPVAPEPAPDVPGLKILQGLLKATLFTDFFVYHAHLRYLDRTAQERVARLIRTHPLFYCVCKIVDFFTRLLILLIVIATVTGVAWGFVWKTFFSDYFSA